MDRLPRQLAVLALLGATLALGAAPPREPSGEDRLRGFLDKLEPAGRRTPEEGVEKDFAGLLEDALSGRDEALTRGLDAGLSAVLNKLKKGEALAPGEDRLLGLLWRTLPGARVPAEPRPEQEALSRTISGLAEHYLQDRVPAEDQRGPGFGLLPQGPEAVQAPAVRAGPAQAKAERPAPPAPGAGLVGAPLDKDLAELVDKTVREQMKRSGAVGMAVGLIHDDKIVYLQGYGLADKEKGTPVTPETMFRWASVSKPITAVSALQLRDQGKLDLDRDIRKYVPEFPQPLFFPAAKTARDVVLRLLAPQLTAEKPAITPRQLLDHQSGVVHYSNGTVAGSASLWDALMPRPFQDPVQALRLFDRSPLVSRPGEEYNYSTHGYVLLSAVVQRAGEKPFAEQVDERIAKPLGMRTLQPDYPWADIPDRAQGYDRTSKGKVVKSSDEAVHWKLGGGGFISSVEDMARFATGLMQGKLVSPETERMMWTPQKTSSGKTTSDGLGFEVSGQGQDLKVSHNGAQPKARTRMVFYPRAGQGVVVMTNSEWVDPGEVSTAIWGSGVFDRLEAKKKKP